MRALAKSIALPVIRHATRSYITGESLNDAADLAQRARLHHMSCTLCYWNDSTEDPRIVAREYANILDYFAAHQMDGALAIKLPALWGRETQVREVVSLARANGALAVFDSHGPELADANFRILEMLGSEGLGVAIPGRWKRSLQDADRAVELGLRVRVVKGEWPDPHSPDIDFREGYLRVIERLAGRAQFVGVATHDAPLAAQAMQILADAGTPFEQEFVFPLPVRKAFAEGTKYGARARLYIPYGETWLPYSVKRALRNPAIMLKLVRDFAIGRKFTLPPLANGEQPS